MTHEEKYFNWNYIDDYNGDGDITKDIKSIHCDTRDFYILLSDETKDKDITQYNNDNIIKTKDILPFLKSLEVISGGQRDWRLLSFNRDIIDDISGWDLKYIRLYRISDTDEWVVCKRDKDPVNYSLLNKDNIIKIID